MLTAHDNRYQQDGKLTHEGLQHVVQLGRFSFDFEQKRQESIIKQAGDMLTGFSVVSAAILAVIPIILKNTNINQDLWLIFVGIASLPLISSLVLTILAEWRRPYSGMYNAQEIQQKIEFNIHFYTTAEDFDAAWIDQLSNIQASIKKLNDLRVKFLIASMTCFLVAISIIVLTTIVLLVIAA